MGIEAENRDRPDVGETILRRRSIRRFDRARPVPRDLVLQVLDAARWAPSSCNLQTWDFILVEDEERRRALAEETRSVLIAPVAIFVIYDRELAREGLANVQSASAAVMTMLLKATSLGLGSLWVNALGNRDRVRALLEVPDDFEVLALVCLGWPAAGDPPPAPERRALGELVHVDRYAGKGGLPKSPDPGDWTLDEIGLYLKRKLQSGTRYNKPDPSVFPAMLEAVRRRLGASEASEFRLLDALPGTGIVTEALANAFPRAELAVLETTAENHFFASRRAGQRVGFVPWPDANRDRILGACAPPGAKVQVLRESGGLIVMPRVLPYPVLASGPFDAATLVFRLEGVPGRDRPALLATLRELLRPEGRLVLAYTSRRSWHGPAFAVRRRFGRDSVEYAPVPDPNVIGPYEALSPGAVRRLARAAGFEVVAEDRLLPLPDVDRLRPRIEQAGGIARWLGRAFLFAAALARPFETLLKPFARIRVLTLRRP